jgi:NAD(P)-dependent dehydrogenase (short-subunit alcohol dehydrogenase family)
VHSPGILVTGAASGIGRATVEELLAAGRPVTGVDVHDFDLADPDAVAALAAERHAVVVNCAGLPGTHPPDRVVRVNLLAPRRLAQDAEIVVNVASVAAHRSAVDDATVADVLQMDDEDVLAWVAAEGLDGPAAYDFTKKALVALTLQLCAEHLGTGRRAVSVSPGPTETPILADFEASMGAARMRASADLVGRHATPDDVAAVIAFLLSPAARWVNGIDVRVDGGLLGARQAGTATAAPVTSTKP